MYAVLRMGSRVVISLSSTTFKVESARAGDPHNKLAATQHPVAQVRQYDCIVTKTLQERSVALYCYKHFGPAA